MNVRYEDAALVIVDKPSGTPTQPGESSGPDLFSQVQARWPKASLHHRLDQPASGLVLFVLDPRFNGAITDAFREHRVGREYLAVLAGEQADAAWVWPVEGKPARTQVTRLGGGEGMSAVRCALHTGRNHQIRRHAAHAGHPIVGDRRYGAEVGGWWPRLALHAAVLRLRHPADGRAIEVTSPMPEDLAALWARAGG